VADPRAYDATYFRVARWFTRTRLRKTCNYEDKNKPKKCTN